MSRKIIVYGGKGALGSICVNYFKSKNFVSYLIKLHGNFPIMSQVENKNCKNEKIPRLNMFLNTFRE